MCGTAGATTGKTKGAFSHYVLPGFLPLERKCFASVHRLGRWEEDLLPPSSPQRTAEVW